jgi:hypothetical protein
VPPEDGFGAERRVLIQGFHAMLEPLLTFWANECRAPQLLVGVIPATVRLLHEYRAALGQRQGTGAGQPADVLDVVARIETQLRDLEARLSKQVVTMERDVVALDERLLDVAARLRQQERTLMDHEAQLPALHGKDDPQPVPQPPPDGYPSFVVTDGRAAAIERELIANALRGMAS